MDVELAFAGGERLAARWGETYGHFGVELRQAPPQTPATADEQDAPREWDVTSHPRWAQLAAEPITQARGWSGRTTLPMWGEDRRQSTGLPRRQRMDPHRHTGNLAAGRLIPARRGRTDRGLRPTGKAASACPF